MPDLTETIASQLLSTLGRSGSITVEPIDGAGNNRVSRVVQGEMRYLLKQYFSQGSTDRDRLTCEYSFLSFARERGILCCPAPLAKDHSKHAALYEYMSGRRPRSEDISDSLVEQVLDFFMVLNAVDNRAAGAHLETASDAHFSISQYIRSIEGRLRRLQNTLSPTRCSEKSVLEFTAELGSSWERVKSETVALAKRYAIDLNRELVAEERILSQSDFGFHNTIISENEKLCFVDFEYAGWDDPARALCDFFSQVALPVPLRYFERFTQRVQSLLGAPHQKAFLQRVAILLPSNHLKWCCIILNHFLPQSALRRQFAQGTSDEDSLQSAKEHQFALAQEHFQRLPEKMAKQSQLCAMFDELLR